MYFLKIFFLLCFFTTFVTAQKLDWVMNLGSGGYDEAFSIDTDSMGNLYTMGNMGAGAGMNPSSATPTLSGRFIQKVDNNRNFLWATGVGAGKVEDMAVDESGNVYVVGIFGPNVFGPIPSAPSRVDMDPDPVDTFFITALGGKNTYVIKLDPSGDFLWAAALQSTSDLENHTIHVDNQNNIIVGGHFYGTTDFDPGSSVHNLTVSGGRQAFVLKLNSAGQFVWVRQFGENDEVRVFDIAVDEVGNVYTLGSFGHYTSTIDFDPSPSIYNVSTTILGRVDYYIVRYSPAGVFEWVRNFSPGGNGMELNHQKPRLAAGTNGTLYATGTFKNTINVNHNGGIPKLLTSKGNFDVFLASFDTSGTFRWANSWGNEIYDDKITAVAVDEAGFAYVSGSFAFTVDFDPGYRKAELQSNAGISGYICKYDGQGNFIWTKELVASTYHSMELATDRQNNLFGIGQYYHALTWNEPNGNVNINARGQTDLAIAKYNYDTCAHFVVQVDTIADVTCSQTGYIKLNTLHGAAPYTYTWNALTTSDSASVIVDSSGIYRVTVTDVSGCEELVALYIDGPLTTTNAFDLDANLVTTPFRSGFPTSLWVDAYNNGCLPVSGQILLVMDSLVNYDSASIAPDYYNGDTLIWNFTNWTFDSSWLPQVFVTTSVTAAVGDSVHFILQVTPSTGDIDTSNNYKQYSYSIINSYDPNNKTVYPAGACFPNYVLMGQQLTYTINFQNTGNAEAIHVNITDELPSGLDINSLDIVSKSHPNLITEILPDNTLRFGFENIYLPDSTTNESASHGFVVFELLPKPLLPIGTTAENKAAIYFDFNEPIITNTVQNTFIDTIPHKDSIVYITTCDSFTYHGQTHTNSGVYTHYLTSAEGCDSTVLLHLTLNISTSAMVVESACESYVAPDGAIYTTPGIYSYIIPNSLGCDSVVYVDLTILTSTTTSIFPVSCGDYTSPSGRIYTNSGAYWDTIPNYAGCDSIIYIGLNVRAPLDTTITLIGSTLYAAYYFNYSYQWLNCDSNYAPISGETGFFYSAPNNGNYAVVVSTNACVDTSSCYSISTYLANNTLQNRSDVRLYPNPVNDYLSIESSTFIKQIVISNALGQVVGIKTKVPIGITEIPLGQQAGIYWVTMCFDNGTKEVYKVIKL